MMDNPKTWSQLQCLLQCRGIQNCTVLTSRTHLFNFIQPFLILGQLGHEGLMLQPFLMKLLGLVSAAVPRHQHLLTHPVSQLSGREGRDERERERERNRDRCQFPMSRLTVNNCWCEVNSILILKIQIPQNSLAHTDRCMLKMYPVHRRSICSVA